MSKQIEKKTSFKKEPIRKENTSIFDDADEEEEDFVAKWFGGSSSSRDVKVGFSSEVEVVHYDELWTETEDEQTSRAIAESLVGLDINAPKPEAHSPITGEGGDLKSIMNDIEAAIITETGCTVLDDKKKPILKRTNLNLFDEECDRIGIKKELDVHIQSEAGSELKIGYLSPNQIQTIRHMNKAAEAAAELKKELQFYDAEENSHASATQELEFIPDEEMYDSCRIFWDYESVNSFMGLNFVDLLKSVFWYFRKDCKYAKIYIYGTPECKRILVEASNHFAEDQVKVCILTRKTGHEVVDRQIFMDVSIIAMKLYYNPEVRTDKIVIVANDSDYNILTERLYRYHKNFHILQTSRKLGGVVSNAARTLTMDEDVFREVLMIDRDIAVQVDDVPAPKPVPPQTVVNSLYTPPVRQLQVPTIKQSPLSSAMIKPPYAEVANMPSSVARIEMTQFQQCVDGNEEQRLPGTICGERIHRTFVRYSTFVENVWHKRIPYPRTQNKNKWLRQKTRELVAGGELIGVYMDPTVDNSYLTREQYLLKFQSAPDENHFFLAVPFPPHES